MRLRDGLSVERLNDEVVVLDQSGEVVHRATGNEVEALTLATQGVNPSDVPDHLTDAIDSLAQAEVIQNSVGLGRRKFLLAGGATWAAATATTFGFTEQAGKDDGMSMPNSRPSSAHPKSAAQAEPDPVFDLKADKLNLRFNVKDYGAVGDGIADDKPAVLAAIAAADAAGGGRQVFFPAGTYEVGTGLSMAGSTCSLVGEGSTFPKQSAPDEPKRGSVIKASNQTGPVLDLEGWEGPDSYRGGTAWGDFCLQGSGVADPTKANKGLSITGGVQRFRNIYIWDTGGAGVDFNRCHLGTFDDIVVLTPVGATANDVPYFTGAGDMNGNHFRGLGCRSMTPDNNTGASGAHVYEDNVHAPSKNKWDRCWFEFMHVPDHGTLFHLIGGTGNVISDTHIWDCGAESEATNTSAFRFDPAREAPDYGGNTIRGQVPGWGNNETSFDTGIDMRQSRNLVQGVKGYKGRNVTIAAGVHHTSVRMAGGISGVVEPGVLDNSGNRTNVWSDDYLGTETRAGVELTAAKFAQLAAGPTIVQLTQAAYDELGTKDPNTLYVVVA